MNSTRNLEHLAKPFFSNKIDQIANGVDIWVDKSNPKDNSVLKQALSKFSGHCLTQHNNECLVKLSALMAATGKTKIQY
jgi:hypothetical protein